ncbi:MAG: hypothetical protein JEZ08_16515 [Clostridiales bacterium]|nr:hypothetical protein [Clostridiales bacterium]
MNKKKRIIIGFIVVFAILVFIDLAIRQPWKTREPNTSSEIETNINDSDTSVDGESEIKLVDNSEENTDSDDVEGEIDGVIDNDIDGDIPYFLEDRNKNREIYSNAEFSREVFEIGKGDLSKEDKDDILNTLNLLYKVVHLGEDKSILAGHVEGVSNLSVTDARFNGFVNSMEELPDYGIDYSIQISENVHQVHIRLAEVMGDGTAGHKHKSRTIPTTYNTETKLLSFQETIQRHPLDVKASSEMFTIHAYMVEANTEVTKVYLAITNNSDHSQEFIKVPEVVATIVALDGTEGKIKLSIFDSESSDLVFSDKPRYTVATVRAMFDTITSIEFITEE